MFLYQENNRFFAQVQKGLEEFARNELELLGAEGVKTTYCGLYFSAHQEDLYKIVLGSRICSRILAPLASFSCYNEKKLYKNSKIYIQWENLFTPKTTFQIISNVSNSRITHSHYASLVLKDSIVDYLRKIYSIRPNVNKSNADIILNLFITNNHAIISLDLGGGALNKRKYRKETVLAPLSETTAAALVQIANWNGDNKLIDPLCGSGTILAEAMMRLCRIPPTIYRIKFGLFFLPDFSHKIFNRLKGDLLKKIKPLKPGLIEGNDFDIAAVKAAKTNLKALKPQEQIKIYNKDYRQLKNLQNTTIITNLPYGKRLRVDEKFYQEFGDFLKNNCKNSTAWLLCPNLKLVKSIGLRTSRKIPIFNGPLEARFVKIEIY